MVAYAYSYWSLPGLVPAPCLSTSWGGPDLFLGANFFHCACPLFSMHTSWARLLPILDLCVSGSLGGLHGHFLEGGPWLFLTSTACKDSSPSEHIVFPVIPGHWLHSVDNDLHMRFASSSRSLCCFFSTGLVYGWTHWGCIWRSWRAELANLQRWVMSLLYAWACWRFRWAPSGMTNNLTSHSQHSNHLMHWSQIWWNWSMSGLTAILFGLFIHLVGKVQGLLSQLQLFLIES